MRSPFRFLLVLSLVFSFLPGVRADEDAPAPSSKWEKDIAAFEAKDKENPPAKGPIVFVGSSSMRRWTTLQEDFPHHRVLNRGFGGSQLKDSVYFADRIVTPYQPRMIFLYAGSNDIAAGTTPERVFADFQAFVEKVRAKQPEVPINYISIAPNPKRWAFVDKFKAANAMIKDYISSHPHLVYIDVYPAMLGSDGMPLPDIYVADKLHMNPKGYKIWTEILNKYLPAADQ